MFQYSFECTNFSEHSTAIFFPPNLVVQKRNEKSTTPGSRSENVYMYILLKHGKIKEVVHKFLMPNINKTKQVSKSNT